MQKISTESASHYNELESASTRDLLTWMNQEDLTVPQKVQLAIPQIEHFVNEAYKRLSSGGRMFYIGSGTSGRLGVVDASELPPTFGVAFEKVIGLIAGGDGAIRKAVEGAEDDILQGYLDLEQYGIGENDVVLGIAASGRTPYVAGALEACKERHILTGSISCNEGALISTIVDCPIEIVVGPEFVTGSTRLKAGTAQKLVLNMISTSLMIKLGHVKGNKMVDMQLSNKKLVDRGTKMIMEELPISYEEAQKLLLEHGSVRNAIANYQKN